MKCSNFTCDGVHVEGRTPFRANGLQSGGIIVQLMTYFMNQDQQIKMVIPVFRGY